MIDIKEVLLLWFVSVYIKNRQVLVFNLDQINNLQMNFINQLLKRLIEEFTFKDNILGADLANMQLINKFNKRFKFLLRLIEIYSKICIDYSFKR